MSQKAKIKSQKCGGQAILTAVVFFMFISMMVVSGAYTVSYQESKSSRDFGTSKKSFFLAESGVEDLSYRIIMGKNYDSVETLSLDGIAATTTVVDLNGNEKEVTAIGVAAKMVRKSKMKLKNSNGFVFNYGVQVGSGGVEMGENSDIVGNIYSNGSISGSNGAEISGDVIVAGRIEESLTARSINCVEDQIVGKTNPQIDFAQSFVAPFSDSLAKVSLYLKKVGNPSSRTVKIVADNGGSPDDESLASAVLNKDLVTDSYGWIDATFSVPPLLIAGNTYWIILDANQDNNKYWVWCNDSIGGYGGGAIKYSKNWSDDPWTQNVGDLNFKTYFGSGSSFIEDVIVMKDVKANTIVDSKICGDAYYKSIDSDSLDFLNNPTTQTCGTPNTGGTAYPGSSDPPVENMPISQANIDQWKADAGKGGVISGNYSVTSDVSLGPKEITGDLLLESNNKRLTVTGTIYVHGNIDVENGSSIRCAASYGSNSCLIIADGWIHTSNNGTFAGSGTAGSFIMLLTTAACDGSFSLGCTHHNGAVDVHNNATGVIFYAQNGKINLHNGVSVTEVTAYKLSLDNNASVTYDQGLANSNFKSGPSGGYSIENWQEIE